jgi:hypothetical protein
MGVVHTFPRPFKARYVAQPLRTPGDVVLLVPHVGERPRLGIVDSVNSTHALVFDPSDLSNWLIRTETLLPTPVGCTAILKKMRRDLAGVQCLISSVDNRREVVGRGLIHDVLCLDVWQATVSYFNGGMSQPLPFTRLVFNRDRIQSYGLR